MLLTRKNSSADRAGSSQLVASLARGIDSHNRRGIATLDRRAFLRRSGLGVGAGIAATQLTLVPPRARRCASTATANTGSSTR
jgi:formate dehydrogenase major subunit